MRLPAEQPSVGFASLNSTLTTFLGGKQKAWMTLDQQIPTAYATNSPTRPRDFQTTRPTPQDPNTPLGPITDHHVVTETAHQHSLQWNWRRRSLEQGPSNSTSPVLANMISQRKDSAGHAMRVTNGVVDTVLPSPAPSDDVHPDLSNNVIDFETEQENPAARMPIDLAARSGGIDGRRSWSADQSQSLPLDEPTVTSDLNYALVPHTEAFSAAQKDGPRKRSIGLSRPQKKRPRIQTPNGQPLRSTESNEGDALRGATLSSVTYELQTPPTLSVKQFVPILDNYVTRFGCNPTSKDSIELARVRLLKDACNTEDCFYLVLHQLYCLYSAEPQTLMQLPGFIPEHVEAFDTLAQLLLRNNMLPDYATKWFSTFPAPIQNLLLFSTGFQTAYNNARNFLLILFRYWHNIRARCKQRMYPPLVDELVYELRVESEVFQRVAFTALLRGLWGPHSTQWYQRAEVLFRQDQINSAERRSRISTANPSTAAEKQLAHQKLVTDYQTLRIQHLREIQTRSGLADTVQQSMTEQPIARVPTQRMSLPSPHEPDFALATASGNTPHVRSVVRRTQSLASVPVSNPHVPQPSIISVSNRPPTQSPHMMTPSCGSAAPVACTSVISPRARAWQTQQAQARSIQGYEQQSGQLDLNRPPPISTTEPHILLSSQPGRRSWCDSFQPGLETLPPGASGHQEANRHQAPAISCYQGSYTTRIPSQMMPFGAEPLIPPANKASRFNPHPTPTSSALHQAHLRHPTIQAFNGDGTDTSTKLYRYVAKLALPPQTIKARSRIFVWSFQVPEVDFRKIPPDTPGSHGAPARREVFSGSQMYRIRCAKFQSPEVHTNESDWTALESVWPPYLFVEINGVHVDIRRKQHHGKDLPVDITPHVKEGVNKVIAGLIGPPKEDDLAQYALAVESIHVIDHKHALEVAVSVPAHKVLEQIKASLTSKPGDDDDLTVVDNTITIDLIDPFSARIFDIPVRGLSCRHRECFDHEIYLQTRNENWSCMVDEWRCPICGADARPQNLIVDCFLAEVKEELVTQKRIDTKTIVIDENGTWRAKRETRDDRQGDQSRIVSTEASFAAGAPGDVSLTSRRESEVIELDDD